MLSTEAYFLDEHGVMHPKPGYEDALRYGDMGSIDEATQRRFNSFSEEKIDATLQAEEDEYDPEAGDITL